MGSTLINELKYRLQISGTLQEKYGEQVFVMHKWI